LKVRIITARPYHALFMHNMLIRPTEEELITFGEPDFTIYNAGAFPCNRYTDTMTSSCTVSSHLTRRESVILGTMYAGEMKKLVFSIMHFVLPKLGILSLHAGANVGKDENDVSLFFGLSGTGKTTLSTDPNRPLIGDDEHAWSDVGIANIEGGCYAKTIDLNPKYEPEIHGAIRFGTVLENVVFDEGTREVDYMDGSVTLNTRAAYPIEYVSNARIPCTASHPKNIIMLCCDAFGVLPPVSKLTTGQAMYHFVQGYTAKIAGTEMGVTEPEATFSACFGGVFLMMSPMRYATLLADKMEKHGTTAWLVNTGWTGGGYGEGSRISLPQTRAIIDAIHSGELTSCTDWDTTPVFNLAVPKECTGVPAELLNPSSGWADKEAFTAQLNHLGELFASNFDKYRRGETLQGMPEAVAAQLQEAEVKLHVGAKH